MRDRTDRAALTVTAMAIAGIPATIGAAIWDAHMDTAMQLAAVAMIVVVGWLAWMWNRPRPL